VAEVAEVAQRRWRAAGLGSAGPGSALLAGVAAGSDGVRFAQPIGRRSHDGVRTAVARAEFKAAGLTASPGVAYVIRPPEVALPGLGAAAQ
jgi:hypothetical protein